MTASAICRATLSTIFFEWAAICKLGLEGIISKKANVHLSVGTIEGLAKNQKSQSARSNPRC